MTMKNYNILTLGASGAGKTVFLASLFKQLLIQDREGFFLEAPKDQQDKKLVEIYKKIIGKSEDDWPTSTWNITDWEFICCVKNHNIENFPVCKFTYIDYPGGLITDILKDQKNYFNFKTKVPNADAVLAIIDGFKLLKFMEDQDLSDKKVINLLQKDLPNIMQLVDKCKKDTPVHFIISKWDLLESRYKLSELRERLLEKVPEFKAFVKNRVNAGCPVRLIPVSSIGSDFATLQPDGSMKKNPGAIPKPFQLEIPIACVLIDRVNAYINTLQSGHQDSHQQVQDKNIFLSLYKQIQSFLNRQADLPIPKQEERLQEIKDEETALNYLVGTFVDHLQKFEVNFPAANLGGEIICPDPPVTPPQKKLFNPTLIRTLKGHQKVVCSVGLTSDGQTLFSSSHDRSVRFWQVVSGKQLQGMVREKSGWVRANLSQDNQRLFTSCEDNTIKVWDSNTCKRIYKPLKGHSDLINGFVVSPDGHKLISASRDKTLKVWQLGTSGGTLINTLIGHQGFVYALAVAPDWHIVASGGSDKRVLLWELHSGNLLHTLDQHPGFIRALAFSSDGNILVSGGYGGTLYVWDPKTRNLRYELTGHTGAIFSLAISPDNCILASGSDDRTIKLWDLSTGTIVSTLNGHIATITTLAFSPNNQTLASGSFDRTIKIWKLV
ncbi:WD40 repeat domain-containing protein [Moorena sp. SIO3F7]|uniref:WD40 repeat domain-containing protein n=2 Tax=unclassified Moorena TaxID=2683338 RepID=UPI0025F8064A|nr:WD40 repeat domain-containing protein [Moorena sp. SIO3F7]